MAGISKKIIKTKSGELTKYTITYRDVFGKQHTAGIYDTKKEAKNDLHKYTKITINDKDVTIDYILKIYVDSRKKKKCAANTIRDYENYIKNYLNIFEGIQYKKISAFDWQEYILNLSNEKSPYVAQGCFRLLRAAFRYSNKYKVISENIFLNVEAVKLPKVKHNHFSLEEIILMLEICRKELPEFYALFFAFIGTGMREGELFGLYKSDFDYKNKIINVCRQFTNGEQKNMPKTSSSIRKVYIFPALAEVINDLINKDKTNSLLVFHNSAGKHLNPSNVRSRWWAKLLKKCGYEEKYARMHDLRGSNTDIAFELGLTLSFQKEQLGHSSATTTLDKYAQRNLAMINDGMNKFEAAFSEKCEQNVSKAEQVIKSNIIYFSKYNRRKG